MNCEGSRACFVNSALFGYAESTLEYQRLLNIGGGVQDHCTPTPCSANQSRYFT